MPPGPRKQLFPSWTNHLVPAVLLLTSAFVVAGSWTWYHYHRSDWRTGTGLAVEQPVQFSHRHHVGELGVDCRYCHSDVENSPVAGVPATEVCMTCHSRLFTESPLLEPVRDSLASGRPLKWNRVYDLPGHVYFDHSIHVAKGVGCTTCHGRVNEMALTELEQPLFMKWCLDCHEAPARHLRPPDLVFDPDWSAPARTTPEQFAIMERERIHPQTLRDCNLCHR